MSTLVDRVADLLYPQDGSRTADIKFYCAGETPTSVHVLAGRVHQSLLAVQNGEATPVEDFTGY